MERTQTLNLDFTSSTPVEFYCDTFAGDMHSCTVELTVTPTPKNGELLLCSFLKNNVVVDTVVVRNNQLTIPYSVLKAPGEYTAAFAVADMESRLTAPLLLTVRVAEDRVALAPTEDMDDQSLVCYILEQAASTARAATEEVLSDVSLRIDATNAALEETKEKVVDGFDQVTTKFAQVDQVNGQQADRLSDLYNALSNTEERLTKAKNDLTARLDTLESDLESELYVMDQQDAALTSRVEMTENKLSTLTEEVTAGGLEVEAAIYAINQQKLNSSSGDATLTSPTSSVCCSVPEARWVRIGNMVILAFGFFSSGYNEFTLTGLPFSANSDGYTVSLHHVRLVKDDFVSTPDMVVDMCQTNKGTTTLTVRRHGVDGAVLAGTLIYFTDDE